MSGIYKFLIVISVRALLIRIGIQTPSDKEYSANEGEEGGDTELASQELNIIYQSRLMFITTKKNKQNKTKPKTNNMKQQRQLLKLEYGACAFFK